MYINALFFTFALMMLGVGGLELGLTFAHAQAQRVAVKFADSYFPAAEQSYASSIAAKVSQNQAIGAISVPPSSPAPACTQGYSFPQAQPNATPPPCNYYVSYQVQTTGGTGTGLSGSTTVTSQNVNATAGEQRIAAVMTVTTSNSAGLVLAKHTRTIVLRIYPEAPYATVVDSTLSQDPYQQPGKPNQQLSEGDVAGCTATPNPQGTMSCQGSSTLIQAAQTCNENGTVSQTLQQEYCQNNTPAPASTPNTSGAWEPVLVPNQQYQTQTWTNSNGSTGAQN